MNLDNHTYVATPIPDDFIVCDFCDAPIVEFPVPVFCNTHALCPECYRRVQR